MRIIPTVRSLLFTCVLLALSAAAFAQFSVSVSFAPPELPVYEQPLCPGDGYLWTPGYWAYGSDYDDYYWVPGTWVQAPEPGLLWTPAYWGWGNNGYVFNEGYWGTHVGFYGGVSYGFGYSGDGYEGGRWQGGQFYYNRTVNNVSVTNIHNTYNTTITNTTINRVSYNGGSGGITVRATAQQESFSHEKHIAPVAAQTQQAQAAHTNPQQRASTNHGTPAVAATPKSGEFHSGTVAAKPTGTPYARAAVPPAAARPENNAAPTARPATKTPPETNRAEPTRQPAAKPEPTRAPMAQPNNKPAPQPEPAPRSQTPAPSERPQPARTPPPSETKSAPPKRPQPAPMKPEPKKEEPKRDEKPQ